MCALRYDGCTLLNAYVPSPVGGSACRALSRSSPSLPPNLSAPRLPPFPHPPSLPPSPPSLSSAHPPPLALFAPHSIWSSSFALIASTTHAALSASPSSPSHLFPLFPRSFVLPAHSSRLPTLFPLSLPTAPSILSHSPHPSPPSPPSSPCPPPSNRSGGEAVGWSTGAGRVPDWPHDPPRPISRHASQVTFESTLQWRGAAAAGERRWVECRSGADPTKLPVEWASWLSRSRLHAPTPDEIAALAQHRAIVKQRAKLWEQEEERRRFREKSIQHDMQRHEGAGDTRVQDLDAEGAARMTHCLSQAMLHRKQEGEVQGGKGMGVLRQVGGREVRPVVVWVWTLEKGSEEVEEEEEREQHQQDGEESISLRCGYLLGLTASLDTMG
ncbi:unnamed protein product [Closterium sp. Naga37s-1]|nr:unnamed protein product [Closterium sp. Naga37s-1]